MAYVRTAFPVCVTIVSTGSKFGSVSELHVLTLAACFYVLLVNNIFLCNWTLHTSHDAGSGVGGTGSRDGNT